MAVRPVFVVADDKRFCVRENVEFEFCSGFSETQKRKNIRNLHQSYLRNNTDKKILEISSKSEDELGGRFSAFNLMIRTKRGSEFSVESAFQSSKVFKNGGPYKDLLLVPSRVAKKDERLRNSGDVIGFNINGMDFATEPKTYFYNWLYINALSLNPGLAEAVTDYDAFTDIEFNPKKSINCQAEAAAIYTSLKKQSLLEEALKDKEHFRETVYEVYPEAEAMGSIDVPKNNEPKKTACCPAYKDCYHFVASTKYRKNLFYDEDIRNRLQELISDVLGRKDGVELVVCTVAYNHIHVMVKSDLKPSDIAQTLFGATSRRLRQEFPVLVEEAQSALWGGKKYYPIKDEEHYNNCVSYIKRHRPDNTKVDEWDTDE